MHQTCARAWERLPQQLGAALEGVRVLRVRLVEAVRVPLEGLRAGIGPGGRRGGAAGAGAGGRAVAQQAGPERLRQVGERTGLGGRLDLLVPVHLRELDREGERAALDAAHRLSVTLRDLDLEVAGDAADRVVLLRHVDVEGGVLDDLGDLVELALPERPRRLAGGTPDRPAGALHETVEVLDHPGDVELPRLVRGVRAGHVLAALVVGALEPAAGIEAEALQRAPTAPSLGRDRAVGLLDLGLWLLVVDVLE